MIGILAFLLAYFLTTTVVCIDATKYVGGNEINKGWLQLHLAVTAVSAIALVFLLVVDTVKFLIQVIS